MGKWRFRKTEPVDVQGVCVKCKVRKQATTGNGKYRAICSPCHKARHIPEFAYRDHKKDHCEECGFIAKHPCQLDVDHIDGDHDNNDPENFQTLCANCHRLKTQMQLHEKGS